jgi:hypothetical protein
METFPAQLATAARKASSLIVRKVGLLAREKKTHTLASRQKKLAGAVRRPRLHHEPENNKKHLNNQDHNGLHRKRAT